MIKAFGFGEKTGIELPGEEKGICHPTDQWSKSSLASHSIGYDISVTAIQVLQAMNVIANRGRLIPPRISRDAVDRTGCPPAARPPRRGSSPSGRRPSSSTTFSPRWPSRGRPRRPGSTGSRWPERRGPPRGRSRAPGDILRQPPSGVVRRVRPRLGPRPLHCRGHRRSQGQSLLRRPGRRARVPGNRPAGASLPQPAFRSSTLPARSSPPSGRRRTDHEAQGPVQELPGIDIAGNGDPEILGLAYSSLQVQPGDLFAALRGGKTDGLRFVDDALGRGAAAVLAEVPGRRAGKGPGSRPSTRAKPWPSPPPTSTTIPR